MLRDDIELVWQIARQIAKEEIAAFKLEMAVKKAPIVTPKPAEPEVKAETPYKKGKKEE